MSVGEHVRHRKVVASSQYGGSKKSNNPWIKLVNEIRRSNPGISLKEAMIQAKPIYARMKGGL